MRETLESYVISSSRLTRRVEETHARTPSGKFLVAKAAGESELLMVVGRKEASLVDAERELFV